jgi:hypothetical protein
MMPLWMVDSGDDLIDKRRAFEVDLIVQLGTNQSFNTPTSSGNYPFATN